MYSDRSHARSGDLCVDRVARDTVRVVIVPSLSDRPDLATLVSATGIVVTIICIIHEPLLRQELVSL